jgi:hypothetical protein
LDYQLPLERRRDYLRRVIEKKTGRPLPEIIGELCREFVNVPDQMAGACSELAGEEVGVPIVQQWLREFRLSRLDRQWAVMAPQVKFLFEQLVAEEVERRLRTHGSEVGKDRA